MLTEQAFCLNRDLPIAIQSENLQPLSHFLLQENITQQNWPVLYPIPPQHLPPPYNFLLTQPVMTAGIAQYYQRTPKIRTPLYVIYEPTQQLLSRGIVMIVDRQSQRDNALVADQLGEAMKVELGLIQMNLAALPEAMIDTLRSSQTPFGALLVEFNIKTYHQCSQYFRIICRAIAPYLGCDYDTVLHGRANTLLNVDNGQWLARTVEVLTGLALPSKVGEFNKICDNKGWER